MTGKRLQAKRQRRRARATRRASTLRLLALTAALGMGRATGAMAFPMVDTNPEEPVPVGTEMAPQDARDLRHQLQLVNGLGPVGTEPGWTFVPRLDFQEMLTDNLREQHSPREWDIVSYLAPGFSLLGNTPRALVNFTWSPTLSLYARDSSLNALTQQLNGTGTITVVPDLLFLDVRAVAGVQNAYGGIGGTGAIGATQAYTPQGTVPTLAGNAQGLTRNNEVQTSSFGISPYLLHRFADWGTLRLGDSLDVTRSASLSGFASLPFPTGGSNGQTLITHEQNARFVTGEVLESFQDSIDADIQRSQSSFEAGSINPITGQPITVPNNSSSSREVFSDTLTWFASRSVSLFASAGHEDINYSGFSARSIHDLTWSLGATITPNPDSQLTISYGHQNGFNSISASGHYAISARTTLTASYGSTLGTQLENLQNQLNLARSTNNGALVNGQTGGPLFTSVNALPVQAGVFRTDSLDLGAQTTWDRDIFTINLGLSKQTTQGIGPTTTSQAKTLSGTWIHQMRPDMTFNAFVGYSIQDQGGFVGVNSGQSTSLISSIAWQWQLSDTLTSSVRYSFFERQAKSATFSLYQNMLILGVSKTF
jgi:hypothetical protein